MTSTLISLDDVGISRVEVHSHSYRLSPVEKKLLKRLGGKPWTEDQFTSERITESYQMWSKLSQAAGYKSEASWFTTEKTNSKLGKAGLPTVGVTLHAANSAKTAWAEADPQFKSSVASALNCSVEDINSALNVSVCPRATTNCIEGCVTNHSRNSQHDMVQRTRLLRDVLTLMRPDLAIALTADKLRQVVRKVGGKEHARWRVNVSDDIRWEVIAPGLLDVAPRAYTYTKFSYQERPPVDGLSIVYSASEKWADEEIVNTCDVGHRVAVVFDVAKGNLPATWNGVIVSDGDSTDDLYQHPAGTIVGLAVKGPTKAIKEEMTAGGFARPA